MRYSYHLSGFGTTKCRTPRTDRRTESHLRTCAFLTCLILLAVAYIAQTYVYLPLLRQLTDSRDEFLEYAKVIPPVSA